MTNHSMCSRRDLLWATGAAALTGAMPVFGAVEPPPETKRITLLRFPFDVSCISPMWSRCPDRC